MQQSQSILILNLYKSLLKETQVSVTLAYMKWNSSLFSFLFVFYIVQNHIFVSGGFTTITACDTFGFSGEYYIET